MNLINSTLIVGFFTGISRVLGIVREILLSYVIGASHVSDAFVVAFKMPNFFRRFFGEGAFNAALVPQLEKLQTEGKNKEVKNIIENVFSFLTWSILIFVVLVLIFTKNFLLITMPGLSHTPERLELAVTFTRITFPYVFFISLVALMSSILNSFNKFIATAIVPLLLNIIMIAALICVNVYHFDPGTALSFAVFIAGSLQFGWLYILCYKRGIKLFLKKPHLTSNIRSILKSIIPSAFGAGVMQINLMVSVALASFLPVGSMTYLYYADRFNQLPISVFGGAIGTVLLTTLSHYWNQKKYKRAVSLQLDFLEVILHLTFPCTMVLIVLSFPLIHLVYGHGKFTEADTITTAITLAIFALSLPAYVIGKVFTTTFFARQETKVPVRVGFISVLLNAILGVFLMHHYAHVGLALATTLTTWLMTFFLGILLHKRQLLLNHEHTIFSKFMRILLATCIMGGILFFFISYFQYSSAHILHEIFYNVSGIMLGSTLYIIISHLFNINPIKSIRKLKVYY